MEVVVVAYGEHGHVFTARLATTATRFSSDLLVFNRVLASFTPAAEDFLAKPKQAPDNNEMKLTRSAFAQRPRPLQLISVLAGGF